MRLILSHELLDDDHGSADEVRRSLDDIWWINQRLGGASSWPRLLDRAALPPGPVTLLDVGAGTGQMAALMAAHLRARGHATRALVVDRRISHLAPAAAGPAPIEVAAVVADAYQLPFADGSVDLVVCNLFLHHFHDLQADAAATRLLQSLHRVARHALIVNDLERAWPPFLFMKLIAPAFSRITRNDGPASVRQAYTAPELRRLGAGAGFENFEVVRLWPFRLGLTVWKQTPAQRK